MQLSDDYKNMSLSVATLRSEDLYKAFMPFLMKHDPEAAISIKADYEDIYCSNGEVDWDKEDSYWLLDDIFTALDDIAPEGCYFGANEGDGADFGFWEYTEN